MSRFTAILSVLIMLSVGVPRAGAQRELHHLPPVVHPDGYNPDYLNPFVEPLAFQPDFQFFAPADFDTFGGGPESNTGWFATYDRLYTWLTRPEYVQSETLGDFTWGNRFDVGYMTEEDHGWLLSFWHIDGPQAVEVLEQERINVFNEDDEINGSPVNTIFFRGGAAGSGTGVQTRIGGIPERDRNDPITKARDYRLTDTLNQGDFTSFELNKTIRLAQRHYGSHFEPFIGFRYAKFQDMTRHDQYTRFNEDLDPLIAPIGPFGVNVPPIGVSTIAPLTDLEDATIERLTSVGTLWDNQMIGGQLGMRWFKLKGRWNLSGELRAFAFENFQSFRRVTDVETTYYDGSDAGDDVRFVLSERERADDHDAEFVWGGEIRAEAAYAVSRDLSLRGGMSFLGFGRGIARGNDPTQNDEDLTMVGLTFGATLNR